MPDPPVPAAPVPDLAALRGLYRSPSPLVLDKVIDHVDDGAADFIARSPLFVLATSDGSRVDASPRGGPPGFVQVLDPGRVAFGDLSGNNRIDSYRNLVASPAVALLFLVPGLDETLRVNGHASVVTDPAVLDRCAVDGRTPKVAIVVDVTDAFVQCGKALRRGAVWDPASWPGPEHQPSPEAMLKDHLGLDVDPQVVRDNLEAGYAATMWEAGGD